MESAKQAFAFDGDSLRESFGLDAAVLEDIRAVGACLSPRVPELIGDFYVWLEGLPEFARFFPDEQLLTRVKRQQEEYWRDFLRAEVDDGYVKRRRIIGEAHARIELGLLIYLQAMEFVSKWLRREIQIDERLAGRTTAIFSIRKLIKFDSAVVVDTYARQTSGKLERQRERLEQIAEVMRAVTEGDLARRIDVEGPSDVLGASVNDMVKSLSNIAREMGLIAKGDYSTHFAPRSDKDDLGKSLHAMTAALQAAAKKNRELIWIANAQNELGEAMSGNPTVEELSRRVLSHLCRSLDAQVGTQYVVEEETQTLRLAATYATSVGDGVHERWRFGEGLIGQAAAEKRPIVLRNVPHDAARIRWAVGEAIPGHLVVLPVLHEDEVRGVIEIGALGSFSERQLELLERAAPGIGLALTAAESRAQIQQLLEESQAQSEELTAQQEELRQVNDTLAEQARTLESQKENLVATEAMLRQKAVELERTSRYKSEFLANMSHELRTPLNSSLLLAKLLAENREGNLTSEQVNYSKSIYSAGNDLLALINDILDLSKIEAGKLEIRVEPVPLVHVVDTVRHRFGPLAAEKGLGFSADVAADCPEVIHTDPQRLQQILTNLVSNAVKFTEKGHVRLLIRRRGREQVAFTVEDTGIGIASEHQEVIFEAFRQADGTTNRKFGGTGLGLSISRELAELLGGTITLSSAPGQGSAFTAVIPVAAIEMAEREQALSPPAVIDSPSSAEAVALEAQVPASSPVAVPAAPLPFVEDDRAAADSRRIILVIEDDRTFAEILRDLARELGFHCVIASTADEGLRLASEYGPVAVVLDVGLPDHSGLTVLEMLKRDAATRHVPIHVISVHDYEQVARGLGAVGYMLKPVKREQLVMAFRSLEERLSRKVKSLLVVEDDAVQRDAIADLLAAEDVELVAVARADEALAQLRATAFDCIVLDLMLPDMSGFEFLDLMSQDAACPSPPVIVYTARPLSAEEEQKLRRLSKSIIVKGARSPERLLEEVTLFLHQAEHHLSPEKQRMLRIARSREPAFEGRRILLVEDDARNVFALTSVLESKGATVEIARNGREALDRLRHGHELDLVLMDTMMPEMDGLEATRAIRASDAWASLPIIALTAKAMPDDRLQCLAAGANDYIAKPVDAHKLLSLIRVWMPQ